MPGLIDVVHEWTDGNAVPVSVGNVMLANGSVKVGVGVTAGVKCDPDTVPDAPIEDAVQNAVEPMLNPPLTWMPPPLTVKSALPASMLPRKHRAHLFVLAAETPARATVEILMFWVPAKTPKPVFTFWIGAATRTSVGLVGCVLR